MPETRIATASTVVDAPLQDVWAALTDPAAVKHWMFGTTLESTWQPGSPITWTGEWQGKTYADHGVVLEVQPPRRMRYTHFSPLSGLPDAPEHHHTVTVDLLPDGPHTRVTLAQDNNPTEDARIHATDNWMKMLEALRAYVEG